MSLFRKELRRWLRAARAFDDKADSDSASCLRCSERGGWVGAGKSGEQHAEGEGTCICLGQDREAVEGLKHGWMQTDVLPLLSSFPWLPVVHPPQSSTPHHTHSRLVQYHRRHRYLFHFCLGSRDMLMPIPPPLTPNLMARSCLSATMEACTTSSSADPISSSGPPDITSVLAQSRLKFIHVSHLLVHPYPGSSAASPGCRLVPLLPSHHRSSPRPWATKRKLEQEACDHRDDPRFAVPLAQTLRKSRNLYPSQQP